jgi:hypothetical protein
VWLSQLESAVKAIPPNPQEWQRAFFFGLIQRTDTLLSKSLKRWAILNQKLDITLKPLSETRWECRLDNVNTVTFQLHNICEAIKNLRDPCDDLATVNDCESV